MATIYKWNDPENSAVRVIVDGNVTKTVPVGHRIYQEEIDGNDIEPYQTQAELDADEKQSWEDERDILENNIILKYEGNLFYMIPRARHNMAEALEDLEETGDQLDWPAYDAETGEKKRVKIGSVEIKKFRRAIRMGINSLHVQADTQEPVNPWPLGVE